MMARYRGGEGTRGRDTSLPESGSKERRVLTLCLFSLENGSAHA